MPRFPLHLSRRQMIRLGIAGASTSLAGTALATHTLIKNRSSTVVRIPPLPLDAPQISDRFQPMQMLRDFDRGKIVQENGRTIREFYIKAQNSQVDLNAAVSYITWNYNDRVPGPTLRVTQGDRVRIFFRNESGHSHSIHFHGLHPIAMDGVKPVRHNEETVYEFDAQPYGLHLYHCHIAPVPRHISKGLYGLFIVDPPNPRPPADEIVLVMGGYDIKGEKKNDLYAFNGIPNYYRNWPIPIYQNQLVRLYLLNVIEFDPVATFHIHANFFNIYPTGMTLTPQWESDVVTLGTAERHILEFSYPFVGKYMFHPHQDTIAEAGCMGFFDVIENPQV